MKSFVTINVLIVLIGLLGLSNINRFVFSLIYEGAENKNLLKEYVLIGNIKVGVSIIAIWLLLIFLGFKINPKTEMKFYVLTIFHCLFWTLLVFLNNAVGGAGILS